MFTMKVFVVFLLSGIFVQSLNAYVIQVHGKNQNKVEKCQSEIDGTMLDDPTSCAAYYLCVSGVDISLNCPEPFQFNTNLGICDTEANVQCEEPEIITQNPICLGEAHLSFIDNDESCAAYYLCFNEIAVKVNCPPPLHFNPDIHECDLPHDCSDEVEITPPPPTEICEDVQNGNYVNNDESCSAYYVCLNGVGLKRNCPTGLYFDETISECNTSDNVECVDPLEICIGEDNFTSINNPDSCSAYYICMNDLAVPANCPLPLFFNPDNLECDFSENVSCDDLFEPNIACIDKPNGHFVNDESSCAAYYICINDQAVAASCPESLHFNSINDECVSIDESTCEFDNSICIDSPNGTLIADPKSCAGYFFCLDNVALTLFCPNPMYFNPATGHCDFSYNVDCDHSDEDAHCDGIDNFAFVRNPESCAHFFQCIDGAAFSGHCPSPWLFDSQTSECAEPDQVECEDTTKDPESTTAIEVTTEFPTETTDILTDTTTDNISELTTESTDDYSDTTRDENTESTICCETTDGETVTTTFIETTTSPVPSFPSLPTTTTTVATTFARKL